MSDQIQIMVRGWAGGAPEKHVTSNGGEYARFRLASTRGYWDRGSGEYKTAPTEWFTVKAWGNRAANVLASVNKGVPVVVRGHLQLERWQSEDGTERAENAITANVIAIDLDHGEARYIKVVRERADEARDPGDGAGDDAAGGDPWAIPEGTEAEPAQDAAEETADLAPF